MHKSEQIFISAGKKMLDLISNNYSLLLLLQHFNIDFTVGNKTVREICAENIIDPDSFILIANLYNGYYPDRKKVDEIHDIRSILMYLRNSHSFYKNDKYPELKFYLSQLKNEHNSHEFELIEKFFNDYYNEVLEHLSYEEEIAFPFFNKTQRDATRNEAKTFSASEYLNHHTDIETKLTDLKHLFLKYITVSSDLNVKRKFLYHLSELENDLKIHSIIEETVLVPVIERLEKHSRG